MAKNRTGILLFKTRLDSLDSARTRSSGGESRLGLDRARLCKTRTRSDSTFSDSTHHYAGMNFGNVETTYFTNLKIPIEFQD